MKSNNPVRMAVALMVMVIPPTANYAVADQVGSGDKTIKTSSMQASLLSPARNFSTHATFTDGLTYQVPVRSTHAKHDDAAARDASPVAAADAASHEYDTLFMMLGIVALVILQLRRKQNSLPHHPLSLPFNKMTAFKSDAIEHRRRLAAATPARIDFNVVEEAV